MRIFREWLWEIVLSAISLVLFMAALLVLALSLTGCATSRDAGRSEDAHWNLSTPNPWFLNEDRR